MFRFYIDINIYIYTYIIWVIICPDNTYIYIYVYSYIYMYTLWATVCLDSTYIYIHIHIQTHTIQLDITRYVESLHGLEVCVGELKKVEDLTHGMPGLGFRGDRSFNSLQSGAVQIEHLREEECKTAEAP